ncbi:MAG: hypothetical protein WD135_08780 [Ferruginibacter sp.]
MNYIFIPVFFVLMYSNATAQDDTLFIGKRVITLSDVVIDKRLNVADFINKIKNDSSYYKAFRNLRVLGFNAINDIRILDKKGGLKASLFSKTKQQRQNNCRSMQVIEETSTGDFYNSNRSYNYYTAQMYASLFFTTDIVCGETNIVAGTEFSINGKKGMDKHKEQLKTLFFNPGKKINGLPFMSNKTAIYDNEMADKYNMDIDLEDYKGQLCYVFKQTVKPGKENGVMVDEMTTWFDESSFDVVARNYSLSYDAGVYDFKVTMKVQLTRFNELIVPTLIRYYGDWKAITKKRERGVFTATLSAFTK